ncbi:MAG: DUF2141 domain-containing protein, partial [Cytophagia bacterium]|nr:DUF2141 domain-containing protein [Cytophagia bacterium]
TGLAISEYVSRQKPTLSIITAEGAFIAADQDSSEQFEKKFNFTEAEETAVIVGNISTTAPNIIVQLISASSKKVIKETTERQFRFSYLPAGRYMVRVINDTNHNGKLDIGNILTREVPEDVHYYFDTYYKTKVIEVRKNWEATANISF